MTANFGISGIGFKKSNKFNYFQNYWGWGKVGQCVTLSHYSSGIMPAKSLHSLALIYARYFSRAEKRALRTVPVDDCVSEINLLRVLASRNMAAQSSASARMDLKGRIKVLRSYNLLSEQINRLIRAHTQTHNPTDELKKAIMAALSSLDPYDQL